MYTTNLTPGQTMMRTVIKSEQMLMGDTGLGGNQSAQKNQGTEELTFEVSLEAWQDLKEKKKREEENFFSQREVHWLRQGMVGSQAWQEHSVLEKEPGQTEKLGPDFGGG